MVAGNTDSSVSTIFGIVGKWMVERSESTMWDSMEACQYTDLAYNLGNAEKQASHVQVKRCLRPTASKLLPALSLGDKQEAYFHIPRCQYMLQICLV